LVGVYSSITLYFFRAVATVYIYVDFKILYVGISTKITSLATCIVLVNRHLEQLPLMFLLFSGLFIGPQFKLGLGLTISGRNRG